MQHHRTIARGIGRLAWLSTLVALVALAAGCATASEELPGMRLAQHHGGGGGGGGGTTCNQDTDCHIRVPPPRSCPHGGTSVATACCRANYCGVCWSDCPAGTSQSNVTGDPTPTTL